MGLTSKFGFTNNQASTKTAPLVTTKVLENYALTKDEPTVCALSNMTAPVDQPEVVSFGCTEIPQVSSSIKNLYPPKVKSGVQYQIKVEELLSTTSTDDAGFRVDDPIVAYLTIRHTKSSNVKPADVDAVISRLRSFLYKEDGTTRINELMRSALKPTQD